MTQEKYSTGRRKFQHLTKEKRAQIAKAVGIARSILYLELARGTVEQLDGELRTCRKYF